VSLTTLEALKQASSFPGTGVCTESGKGLGPSIYRLLLNTASAPPGPLWLGPAPPGCSLRVTANWFLCGVHSAASALPVLSLLLSAFPVFQKVLLSPDHLDLFFPCDFFLGGAGIQERSDDVYAIPFLISSWHRYF
jgi:hypothetical protein